MSEHPPRRLEPSGDPGFSAPRPQPGWGPGTEFGTEDAARMGLARNTLEGAQLAFLSHLSPSNRRHRMIAWSVLMLFFGLPVLFGLLRLISS